MVLLHFIVRLFIFKAYWLTRSKVNYIHMTNISHIERWRAIFNNYMRMSSVTCHHREGGVWPKCHHGVMIGREGKKKAKFCVTWYVDDPLYCKQDQSRSHRHSWEDNVGRCGAEHHEDNKAISSSIFRYFISPRKYHSVYQKQIKQFAQQWDRRKEPWTIP